MMKDEWLNLKKAVDGFFIGTTNERE